MVISGQLTTRAAGALKVISSHVHPSAIITAEVPEISPPEGEVTKVVMPFALVTGMISDSGLTAAWARTLGLIGPLSVLSSDARTAPISVSPTYVSPLKRPG